MFYILSSTLYGRYLSRYSDWLRDERSGDRIPMGRDFPHPSSPVLGSTQPPIQWVPGLSQGVKRPGRGLDHPTPSSAEVKESVKLYFYSPTGLSWPVVGWTLPFPFMAAIVFGKVL
jgi:hypothetical protein